MAMTQLPALRTHPLRNRVLGAKVFSRPNKAEAEGWRDSLYRVYKSGQQSMRVAVYGCKHDAAMFEVLLRDYCKFPVELGLVGDAFIDTACLDVPKVGQGCNTGICY